MSILNVHVGAELVRVYVDTIVDRNGTLCHGEKMVVLPQARLVVAARGDLVLMAHLASAIANRSTSGYDGALAAMPEILRTEGAVYEAVREMQGHKPLQPLELVIAGWSAEAGAFAAMRWERWEGQEALTAIPVDPWSLSPDAGTGQPGEPDTIGKVVAYAADQVRRLAPFECAVGGELLMAEVSAQGVFVTTVADLSAVDA